MIFKGQEIKISFTNANVLEALSTAQKDISPIFDNLEKSTDLKTTADAIRQICDVISRLVDACGINREELFPTPDLLDYMGFMNTVIEEFHKTDFKSIKLTK